MDTLPINEFFALITGVIGMAIMWLARYFIAWVNMQSGVKKMGIVLILGFVITKIGQFSGTGIHSLNDLLDPNITQSLASWIISMGLWALVKEIQKWMGKYNLSNTGEIKSE